MDNNIIENIKRILGKFDVDCEVLDEIKAVIEKGEKLDFSIMKSGDKFTYRGMEWVYLGLEQGGALCITTNPFCEVPFDAENCNDWRNSSLREKLREQFLPLLDESDILLFEMDLTADNGDTSYGVCMDSVGILSCDLYRKYRDYIPLFLERMWTCTPWSCVSPYDHSVRLVNSDGILYNNNAVSANGYVPACIFRINNH